MEIKKKKEHWTCPICGGKPILLMSKTKHEQGKRHNNIKNGNEILKTPEDYKMWTCKTCDKTMQRKNKTNHEKSEKHKKRVKSSEKCPTCEEDNEEYISFVYDI